MKKTLWLYGALIFAGGIVGGALSNALCRSRTVAAAPAVAQKQTTARSAAARRTVTVSEFVVLDAAGKERAKIDVKDDGQAGFAMCDRDNHPRAQIFIDNQGAPSVRLYDASNKLRISLEIGTYGIPTVRLTDNGGHPRALLGVYAEGEGGTQLYAQVP